MAAKSSDEQALRRDVRFLGKLLGEVIVEQEGRELFELEERIRKLAIQRRRGPRAGRAAAAAELAALLEELPTDKAEPITRAFASYFQLANIAEQHHRIRRARQHAANPDTPPQRGSLAAVLRQARDAGIPADEARKTLASLQVTLAFTAHPTQAARRTVLEKLYRIAGLLEERDRCRLVPRELVQAESLMREEIAALWQTDEVRHDRPTVGDEVKNLLWYVEEILWPLVPELSGRLGDAFWGAYGEPLGTKVQPLLLHSWVGGDMDGNPLVTPDVFEDTVRAHHVRGLRRLLREVRALGGALSQSSRHVRVPQRLLESLARDAAEHPRAAARQGARAEGEPWRRKLGFIEARLEATLARAEEGGAGRPMQRALSASDIAADPGSHGYAHPQALAADLLLVAQTLEEANAGRAGAGRVRAVLEGVRTMGFHIAELESRVHVQDVRDAAAFLAARGPETTGGARLLEVLRRMHRAQAQGGEDACRTFILAMCASADDVLAALECVRAEGLWDAARGCATVDVVPLFETLDALDSAPRILRELFAHPVYGAHVAARGVQEVLVGYSDSGKEVGLLAAAAALRRAEAALPDIAASHGLRLRLFHGRGETVARGGGPAQQAILALPKGAVAGFYKATEQGEALDHKYARPELAARTLELMVGGALLHTLDAQPRPSAADLARYAEAFDVLADAGRREYRSLVWEEPLFLDFFRAASPLDEVARMNIGSRPSRRAEGGLETLRAIPWVFAWTQSRAILPAWYGVGSALDAFARTPGGEALLAEMHAGWPFFRALFSNVEMVLAKTDLGVAETYAQLASEPSRRAVWTRIRAEHARTTRWIRRLTGHRQLLGGNPALKRSIALRNPYVDPMSFLQVELLRRKRAGEPGCERPLLLTINGIAAGLRNTG